MSLTELFWVDIVDMKRTRAPPKRLQNEQAATVKKPRMMRPKPKTAVRPKTVVPPNALSTQQKKLIDQLDTLVGEMTRGNQDLHNFIISFYDETSNNEFTMKLFGVNLLMKLDKLSKSTLICFPGIC